MIDIPTRISFCIALSFININFIFSVSILIITIQLCVFFNPRMPSGYYCPRCQSHRIITYSDHIECLNCGLSFSIESLLTDIENENNIDKDNILAEEELHGILDAFSEEERKKLEKMFEEKDFY